MREVLARTAERSHRNAAAAQAQRCKPEAEKTLENS